MADKNVFVVGATGYIGGSILRNILDTYPNFKVSALVRSEKDVPALESIGVKAIRGSNSDLDKIEEVSSNADIVINAADADDLPLTRAIIAGLKKRAKSTGARPILIHTSGTGVVSDKAEGEFLPSAEKVWNDNVEDDIRSIGVDQPHREIDLEIFKADEEGAISAYIIAPSTIYGTGSGPVRKISAQVPALIRVALEKKKALYAGKGTNVWGNVHVKDLVELYALILALALSGSDKNKGVGKFYFGTAAEHVWGDVARRAATILHKKGLVNSDEAASGTLKEAPSLAWTANNSRSEAARGFALGWKPTQKSILDTLEEDIDAVVAST